MTTSFKDDVKKIKPILKLTGNDGNAFSILGNARNLAKENDWTKEEIDAFLNEAMSGDYNHLLQTCMEHFEVE